MLLTTLFLVVLVVLTITLAYAPEVVDSSETLSVQSESDPVGTDRTFESSLVMSLDPMRALRLNDLKLLILAVGHPNVSILEPLESS